MPTAGRAEPHAPGLSPAETDMRRHLVLRERVFDALEGLSVLGVPVGDLVEETLDMDCAAGVLRDPRPISRAETALRRSALRFRRLLERLRGHGRAWPAPVAPGRVVIDVASTGHNCRRIWEPVARALGSDDVVLAVPARAPAADLFANPKSDYTRALFAAAFNLETAPEGVVAQ